MATLDRLMHRASQLEQTLLSLVKIPLLSRRPTPLPKSYEREDEIVILANGPSLNDTVTRHRDFLRGKALMAVNLAATSEVFPDLKPRYYLIADPLFWILDDKREQLFGSLARHTSWPLRLFIPSKARKDPKWQEMIKGNPNIEVFIYNTTPIEGFPGFCRWCYRKGLGMPRPHNVLIPAITTSLRLPFRKIYLAGADHSWLPEISVTDNNEVLMHQKHFYDRDTSRAATVTQENLSSARLHTILYHMHVAFKAYFTLLDFARSLNKEVINITPGSFIDAFPRMRVPEDSVSGEPPTKTDN